MNDILKDKMAKRTVVGVIVVVILLGLYGGLYLLTTSTQPKIPEDVQKNIDDVNKMASEYNEFKENHNKIVSENTAEYNNYEELLNELLEIVDENGIVKKGHEERATYIAKVLTEVTGVEVKVVDGVLYINNEEDTKEEITTKPPTEKPTEKPTPTPTEAPTEQKTEKSTPTIFESDEVKISYYSAEFDDYNDDEISVYFLVENKTNRSLRFSANTIVINNISYNNILMSDPVSANTKGIIEAQIEDMQILPETITSIGGDLYYFNTSDYRNHCDITINETQI